MTDPVAVAHLVPTKSERDIAASLKARLEETLKPVLVVCAEACALEFNVTLSFGRDSYGRLTLFPVLTKTY